MKKKNHNYCWESRDTNHINWLRELILNILQGDFEMQGQAQPYPSVYEQGAPVDLLHLSEPKSLQMLSID